MQILGIETSSKFLSLAVIKDNEIVAEINLNAYRRLSSLLVPSIKDILKKSNISLEELDGFAVGIGPGSFTGLRVGITTIKALALSLKKPIVAVFSLDIIAQNISPVSGQVCPIIDAKRGNVFSCIYESKNEKMKRLTKYSLTNIKDLLKKINKKTVFLGDGLIPFAKIIKKKKRGEAIFTEQKLWYPKANNLLFLAYNKFKKGIFVNTDKLAPFYLYPKECQIKPNKKRSQ